jgi:16S rRNA (guanine527-N7)-methyltransferase
MAHSDFTRALCANAVDYGVDLSPAALAQLSLYYQVLRRWNDRLHLVAPCSPEEFATRHVLESLLLLPHLPAGARLADVGSGGGLPIIPCLIVRPDLQATLIESSQKKAVFLRESLNRLDISNATIVARPFEETATPDVGFITCRALDSFTSKLPFMMRWAPSNSTLLLFGGENLRAELRNISEFAESLLPNSRNRFLFIVKPT